MHYFVCWMHPCPRVIVWLCESSSLGVLPHCWYINIHLFIIYLFIHTHFLTCVFLFVLFVLFILFCFFFFSYINVFMSGEVGYPAARTMAFGYVDSTNKFKLLGGVSNPQIPVVTSSNCKCTLLSMDIDFSAVFMDSWTFDPSSTAFTFSGLTFNGSSGAFPSNYGEYGMPVLGYAGQSASYFTDLDGALWMFGGPTCKYISFGI